jgi:hypothetical protein
VDLGLWATWYDVDAADEASFVEWTHSTYLPFLQQQPGIAWAAHYANKGGGATMKELQTDPSRRGGHDLPTGCQYVLLVGAASSYTFFNPWVLEMALPDGFAEQLAKRKRDRTEIYAEEARVDGNATEHRQWGSTAAPTIQFGTYNMRDQDAENMLGRWYSQQRLPLMSRMNCCVRTRKLMSSVGWAKHAVLYEFSSLEARMREHEEPHESKTLDPDAWTGKIAASAAYPPGSPFVGERIWPPVG